MATTADSEVIKEFLISLGFKIDEAGMKKFGNALTGTAKGAIGVGGALIAAAIAVEKFVEGIADGMEKLFYISQRTGASITNLKAMEGAFQSAGFAAGKSTEFIEGLAENLRANPGMTEFVSNMFGIETGQMDKAEAAMAIMKKLAEMAKTGSYAVAAQQANLVFGMSERDFNTAVKNIDKIAAIEADRVALLKESKVDQEDLSEQSVDFNNNLRKMGMELGAIGTQFATVLMPAVNGALHGIEWFLRQTVSGIGSILGMTKEDFANTAAAISDAAQDNPELAQRLVEKSNTAGVGISDENLIAKIAQQHGVDPLLADAIWNTESSRSAPGQMYGHDKSGKVTGVGGFQVNPSNFAALHTNEAEMRKLGPNTEAAMGMLERNIKEFGDIEKAIAATNSRPETVRDMVQQFGDEWLAHMPQETQDWMFKTLTTYGKNIEAGRMGGDLPVAKKTPDSTPGAAATGDVNITQNITQNISGDNADAIGKSAAEANRRLVGDITRDMRGLHATPGRS